MILVFVLLQRLQAIAQPQEKVDLVSSGMVKITFVNVVKNDPMVLRDVNYQNPFGETFLINKFKYYVSNLSMSSSAGPFSEKDSYHLVDQDDSATLSFSFTVPAATYTSFSFLLGVDSLHNVSGAQTGALDVSNNMFWTWNTGYIMAKMEGKSPASPFNNTFEFHIGGFAGTNSVLKKVDLQLAPTGLIVSENKTAELVIKCDADTWWQGLHDIKISVNPNVTAPGPLAKNVSDNYSKMFSVLKIINN